jgi:zinc D-Ala-D-Ala dipeptidase
MKHRLVDILKIIPDAKLDIRYAEKNNFLGFPVYPSSKCFLHLDAAHALKKVQEDLNRLELAIKIFDGYRPIPIQQMMWDLIQDEKYVSNPAKGTGRHTRGTAVDLTIIDKMGNELPMPSEFDEFTERAHHDYMDSSKEAIENRSLLKSVMEKNGFLSMPFEWWHYDFSGWENLEKYPSLSLSFDEIEKSNLI